MQTLTNAEYETYEARRHAAALREVETAPLAERKEAAEEYGEALREYPQSLTQAVSYLLNGSFGYGAYRAALNILSHKRMNRAAALSLMAAALNWRCPPNYATREWNKLTQEQRDKINDSIKAEIATAEEQQAGTE